MRVNGSPSLFAMIFVPASDSRKMAKIPGLPADAVIVDLEDAVAENRKARARDAVAALLTGHGSTKAVWVRVNSAATDHLGDDIDAIVHPRLGGVVLPKVTSARDLHIADYLLSRQEQKSGLARGSVPVMATVETVGGLCALDDIVAAAPRLARLCFGAGDFSLDIGLDWPAEPGCPEVSATLTRARTQVVLASRAGGLLPPHDGVYPRHEDLEGLRLEARRARAMGFAGKHAIHPMQVPVIAEVFRPSDAQLEHARRIVRAFEEAEASGIAAITIDGQFVDYPVAARARQLLAADGQQGNAPGGRDV